MITTEQHFLNAKGSEATTQGVIVRLIDGADTGLAWFTDRPFQESTPSAEFIPLLDTVSAVNENVDIFTRRWSYPSITITFHNRPYPCPANADAGNLENFNPDGSGNLWERVVAVKVYVYAGDYAYTSTRWVVRYKGLVNNVRVDANTIRLEVDHVGRHYNRQLLSEVISDLNADAPPDVANEFVPIVLGGFTQNYLGETCALDDPYAQRSNAFGGTGLAYAPMLYVLPSSSYVVCNYAIESFDNIFIESGGPIPLRALLDSFTAGPPPYRSLGWGAFEVFFWLSHAALPTWSPLPDWTSQEAVTDKLHLEDGDTGTGAIIKDGVDDAPGSDIKGIVSWGFANDAAVRGTWTALAGVPYARMSLFTHELQPITAFSGGSPIAELYFGADGTGNFSLIQRTGVASGAGWGITYIQDLTAFPGLSDDETHAYVPVLFRIYTVTAGAGDGSSNNQNMWSCNEVYLRASVHVTEHPTNAWAECEGPLYPSWMATRDRAGELVQTPEGIIEYLLREYLGFADVDIDVSSFDQVADHNKKGYPAGTLRDDIQAHLNLHSGSKDTSDTVIRKLAEQSRFAFCWTAGGIIRLMDLSPEKWADIYATGPDRKVMFGNIVEGSLWVTKTRVYANHIVAESRYFQEDGKFHETIIMDNATSQGTGVDGIGKVKSATAGWQNIWAHQWTDTNVYKAGSLSLAEFLIGETNNAKALWAVRHNMIDFRTAGYTNADLELGDVIELDAESTDPHQKLFGNSWANRRFMVTGINQTFHPAPETQLRAVELYVGLPRGAITGPIDTELYESDYGQYLDVVQVRGNIVIAFSKGTLSDGFAYTYSIDSEGQIGAQLDIHEYENANVLWTKAIKVEEGRVLVVFEDGFGDAKAVTLDVDSGGIITGPVDTLTSWGGGSVACSYAKICERATGVFCVAMASTDNDGYLHTVSVDGAGSIKHEDVLEFADVAAAVNHFSICHVTGDIIFIADERGTHVHLNTVLVTSAGVITGLQDNTSLDLAGLSVILDERPSVTRVADSMIAIAVRTSNASRPCVVVTHALDGSGNIAVSRTDYMDIETETDPGCLFCNIRRVSSSDTMYSVIHNGAVDGKTYVSSIEIAAAGTMASAPLDRAQIYALSHTVPLRQMVLNSTTGLIVAVVRTRNYDAELVTFKIQL